MMMMEIRGHRADPALASQVVEGVVKWFDPERGYGFVTGGAAGGDVLLHANVLRGFGQSSVAEGARIAMLVRRGARGLQASEILSIDAPDAPDLPEADLPEYLRPAPETAAPLPARVKWFDRQKGFGFANAFDRPGDIFIHIDVLHRSGFVDLQTGEAISLRCVEGAHGPLALEIRRWGSAWERAA